MKLKDLERFSQRIGLTNMVKLWGGYSPFPLRVTFSLTMRCNMQCAFCVQATTREAWQETPDREPELSLQEWQGVVDDLAHSFIVKPAIYLTGGEPLLSPNFVSLVRYIKSKGMACHFTSNAFWLERYVDDLITARVDRAQISLDGPAAIHDAGRGVPGVYERAVSAIRALSRVKRMTGQKKPLITLNSVIGKFNYRHLRELVEIAHDAGADAISYQHIMFSDVVAPDMAQIDAEYLLAEMPRIRQRGRELGIAVSFFPHMKPATICAYYTGTVGELVGDCIAPWFSAEIYATGEITPCRPDYLVGNVRVPGEHFSGAWNNKRFQKFRRDLAKVGVFPDCGRCCHRQYQ